MSPVVWLILDNIRSLHNVGSLLRTADGFGVSRISACGITPYPELKDDDRLPHVRRRAQNSLHKTALGAEAWLTIDHFDTTLSAMQAAHDAGFTLIGLEQSVGSQGLRGYSPPKQFALVLGPEVTGMAPEIIEKLDVILEIPMGGKKESLNVSVAGAIALYELTR